MNREETAALFRKNLYNFQVEAGYSECELSRTVNKSEGYIQSISSGRNFPSFSSFIDICEATNRNPAEFFLEENELSFFKDFQLYSRHYTEEQKMRILQFAEAILREGKE